MQKHLLNEHLDNFGMYKVGISWRWGWGLGGVGGGGGGYLKKNKKW
jgi:hypothetical protein